MDKETKEYLDQKYVGLVHKEDMEKLRQEAKASFRKLREESKAEALGWKDEIQANVEESRKQWQAAMALLREELLKGLQQWKEESQSTVQQSNRTLESSLQKIEGDVKRALDQSKQPWDLIVPSIIKEEKKDLMQSIQESKADLVRLGEGLSNLQEQIKKVVEGVETSGEKVRGGLTEVKEELGSMIKFSYADLEKRLNALDARIKVLEKIVLQQP